jgi:hypothetical protein
MADIPTPQQSGFSTETDLLDLIQDLYVSQLKAYKPAPQVSQSTSAIPISPGTMRIMAVLVQRDESSSPRQGCPSHIRST